MMDIDFWQSVSILILIAGGYGVHWRLKRLEQKTKSLVNRE